MAENTTMLDQIIADAIEKAKQDAVRGFINSYGEQSAVQALIAKKVTEWLDGPEGTKKIKELGLEAIEKMKAPQRRY